MRFAIGLLAASLLAGSNASPVPANEASSVAVRDVDAGLFAKIKYYAEYAAASYCKNNDDSSGTPITCATGNCPNVQAAGAVSVLEFDSSALTDMQGFLSVSTSRAEIVLSFRGSSSIRNFIADINILLLPFASACAGCTAHAGFLTAWAEPRTAILAALAATRALHPTFRLVVTGHSLGGAVATLAAAELRAKGYALDLFTYGSPRTGNSKLVSFISSQPGITARVTHVNDPVPRLPPMILTEFRHTTPEYWLSNGDAKKVDYVPADVKVCEGISTTGCNAGTIPTLDLDTHRYYTLYISACSPDLMFKRDVAMSPARWTVVPREEGASDEQLLKWMAADAAVDPAYFAQAN